MHLKTKLWSHFKGIAALCFAAGPAFAGSYTYTSLAPAGSIQPAVGGMNDNDQVVGSFQDPTTYRSHGFLWSQGRFTQIDVGSFGTFLTDINAFGIATGYYYASAEDAKNFRTTAMTYDTTKKAHTDIPFTKTYSAVALSINANGAVVGSSFKGPDEKAFLFNLGKVKHVSVPNSPYVTVGVANNANETMLSGVDLANNEHTYLLRGGKFTQLAPPDGASVNGFGCGSNSGFINASGIAGGSYGVSTGVVGFTYHNGHYRKYAFPGQPAQTTVSGVSSTGVVAGCYLDSSANYAAKGFVYVDKTYSTILVPGSSSTSIVAVNAGSSLAGEYSTGSGFGIFIAQCPADQAPCTQ
jgi:hypothetical protein